ncbi:MAG TPA: hypothetical protein VK452_11735 [Dissulfurispiraceae bacterium]|nr:hypothetical protein [Dissulfurispiraceae bacterium]
MKIGSLSDYLNRKTIILFLLQFVFIVALLGYRAWNDSSIECVRCHSDNEKMARLGFPQFYLTQKMVETESKHPYVQCRDCHLGNGRASEADKAHQGMLKPMLVSDEGEVLDRKSVFPKAILPRGQDAIRQLLPHEKIGESYYPVNSVRNVLWHDRDRASFNFDPEIAGKTCGKSNCHPDQLKQFRTTIMATNFRQRTMRTWLEPYGPQNCGPSFADLPPAEVLKNAGFSFKNTADIQKEINVPFSHEQAVAKQKYCNICHAGCLDCHYDPDQKKGLHNMTSKPSSASCDGNGRGTSMCHTGSMQSRRGGTYIGGSYSLPEGMKPDVHYKKDIHCADCHTTGEKGMGDMQRRANCQDCHLDIEEVHAKSIHKNLDCSACHINELRGYQIVTWGPGKVSAQDNPFKKYSLYYGIQSPPILMKDQRGRWMAVKVFPHSVGNIKQDVQPSGKIIYRWPKGETRDPYYIVGTVDAAADNKHLLWIEIQQASHPFGKGRSCESCHKEKQITVSRWEYMDDQGSDNAFTGGYKIVADSNGLRIKDMKSDQPIVAAPGYKLSDFAAWTYFKDSWQMPGDFSIKAENKKYQDYLMISRKLDAQIMHLDTFFKDKDSKSKRKYAEAKGEALHSSEGALQKLQDFKSKYHIN